MYKLEKNRKQMQKKMDPEIKKIYVGKKIAVLVTCSGHSDYKKKPKKLYKWKKT